MKIAVVGGGIFGVTISLKLSERYDVTLFEKDQDIMNRASLCNHNRVHFGYHYPRSLETSKQSLEGYNSFYNNFKSSIINNFPNYYLIEKNSKVSSLEYIKFCEDMNLNIKEEYPTIDIDKINIESSFLTNEPIFDHYSIKNKLSNLLVKGKIKLELNKKITNKLQLSEYDVVVNTTYSDINNIKNIFNIDKRLLKFQDVVIPIFEMKNDRIGITIMDGEYCSVLPNGNKSNNFLLYHVKYSVIEQKKSFYLENKFNDIDLELNEVYSHSKEYFTFLENSKHIGYYRTIRTIPINNDDSRLSEIEVDIVDDKKIISVLSGKITTCWLIADKINDMI